MSIYLLQVLEIFDALNSIYACIKALKKINEGQKLYRNERL